MARISASGFLGLETQIDEVLPVAIRFACRATSASSSRGSGSVRRNEQILTDVAAIVTQVLPNGNLVIEASRKCVSISRSGN